MARQQDDVMDGVRREFKRQLRGFPREAKRQLTGFGREAVHQLGSGWGNKLARQIFGGGRRTGRRSR
jgi:hypothetical protein